MGNGFERGQWFYKWANFCSILSWPFLLYSFLTWVIFDILVDPLILKGVKTLVGFFIYHYSWGKYD